MAAGAPGELDGQGLVARGARRSTSREGAACGARDQGGRGLWCTGPERTRCTRGRRNTQPGWQTWWRSRRRWPPPCPGTLSGEPRPSRATSSPTGSVSTVPYAGLPCWSFSSASSAAQVIWQGRWLWGTRCGTDRGSPQRRCSWRRSRGGRCCRGSASRRHLPATSAPLQEQLDEPRHDVLGANGDAHCLPWPAGSCGASMRVTA